MAAALPNTLKTAATLSMREIAQLALDSPDHFDVVAGAFSGAWLAMTSKRPYEKVFYPLGQSPATLVRLTAHRIVLEPDRKYDARQLHTISLGRFALEVVRDHCGKA